MTDPEKINPSTAMRAIGESDRTDSYKHRRDEFIAGVDDFLRKVEGVAESDQPYLNGIPIQKKPGVWNEVVGKRNTRVNVSVEHQEQPGLFYFKDEKQRPHFQIIEREVVGPNKVVARIWKLAGADPLERTMFGPGVGYGTRGQVVDLAQVEFREDGASFGLTVRGDGSVVAHQAAHEGSAGYSKHLTNEDEMFAAEYLLREVSSQFFGNAE